MKDLTKYVERVYKAQTIGEKRQIIFEMIDASHAKNTTKAKFRNQATFITSSRKLDTLAGNYMLAGEGLSVL